MVWYVVFEGKQRGIFKDWSAAHQSVMRYPCASYRKYDILEEAIDAFDSYMSHIPYEPSSSTHGAPTYGTAEVVAKLKRTSVHAEGKENASRATGETEKEDASTKAAGEAKKEAASSEDGLAVAIHGLTKALNRLAMIVEELANNRN